MGIWTLYSDWLLGFVTLKLVSTEWIFVLCPWFNIVQSIERSYVWRAWRTIIWVWLVRSCCYIGTSGYCCCTSLTLVLVFFFNVSWFTRSGIALRYSPRNTLMPYQMDGRIMHGAESIKEYNCKYWLKLDEEWSAWWLLLL